MVLGELLLVAVQIDIVDDSTTCIVDNEVRCEDHRDEEADDPQHHHHAL